MDPKILSKKKKRALERRKKRRIESQNKRYFCEKWGSKLKKTQEIRVKPPTVVGHCSQILSSRKTRKISPKGGTVTWVWWSKKK